MPTTKKQTNSNSSFLSKLNPRSAKSRLIIFLVIFALIGGGVMVYRSFAAEGAGVYGSDNLENAGGGASRYVQGGGSKSSSNPWYLPKGASVRIKRSVEPVIWAPQVRICANLAARDNNYPVTVKISLTKDTGIAGSSSQIVRGTAYGKRCTQYFSHTNANARIGGVITNTNQNVGLNVGSMSIEYVTGGGK